MRPISITVAAAAEATGLDVEDVHKLIQDKRLQAKMVMGKQLVLVESLEKLVGGSE